MAPIMKKQSWKKHNELRKLKKKQYAEKKVEKLLKALDPEESKKTEEENEELDFSCVKDMKTISIAVPGSILSNAQSAELRTYLAGQIARAACIFKVDEVVVFNDLGDTPKDGEVMDKDRHRTWKACLQLERILQYLECPQYLRKRLFSVHTDLQFAGLLNPLDAPHHLRATDKEFPFREGVVVNKKCKKGIGCYVDVGLSKDVLTDTPLEPGVRVTLKLKPKKEGSKKLRGVIVPQAYPKAEAGVYWGYEVRLAGSLDRVLKEAPWRYDLVIGTSDKGSPLSQARLPPFHHCLVVFGGLDGLEGALDTEENVKKDALDLFHYYLNTCPEQGSRTIRTEEAILISLAVLTEKFTAANQQANLD